MIHITQYTSAKRLEEKVAGYFKAISTTVEVRQNNEPVKSDSGRPVFRLEYHVPPTVTGLCRYLSILPDTWQSYGDSKRHPEFQTAVKWAAMMIEDYLVNQLLERSKGPEGVKQLLKEQEEESAAPPEDACATVDLLQKRKLLRQLLAEESDE